VRARAAHVGNAKPWAAGACGHQWGNSDAGAAAVQIGCTWSTRAGGNCPAGGLGPF
jgi:hypothetical protein